MYEVTYSVDGIIRKINVNANDAVQAQSIATNMFRARKCTNYKLQEIINENKNIKKFSRNKIL